MVTFSQVISFKYLWILQGLLTLGLVIYYQCGFPQKKRGKGHFELTVTYYHSGVVKSPGTFQLLSLSP